MNLQKKGAPLLVAVIVSALLLSPGVSAQLENGLMVLYHFDGDAQDSSGNGRNATCTAPKCPASVAGKIGSGAFDFDGVDDELVVGTITLPPQGTIAFWANFDSLGGTRVRVLGGADNAESTVETSRKITNQWGTGGGTTLESPQQLSTGTWYHVTETYNLATGLQEIYLDGILVASASNLVNSNLGSIVLTIGNRTGASNYVDAKLDELAVWNRVLPASEVAEAAAMTTGIGEVVCTDGETRGCYDGPVGTEGVGACQGGTQTCANGQWPVSCTNEVTPQPDVCGNGIDEDCDGFDAVCECTAGETRGCYTGPAGTAGVGVCAQGTESCVNNMWSGTCSGQVLPGTEVCDTADNDCDGGTDEDNVCDPAAQGQLANWKLDNPNPYADSSGNGNTLSCSGSGCPTSTTGKAGDGLSFDGNDALTLGNFAPPLAGTIMAWVNPDSVTSRQRPIGFHDAYEFRIDVGGKLGHDFWTGGSNVLSSVQAITAGQWYHLAFTYDGTTGARQIYINGNLDSSGVFANTNPGSGTLSLGQRTGNTEFYAGDMDEVRIYNRVLSAQEILDIFNQGTFVCNEQDTMQCGATDLGACAFGTKTCSNNAWGACVGEVGPAPETCGNGVDEDCDGFDLACECVSGATESCYTGPAGTVGVGVCQAGTRTCVDGLWGACSDVVPGAEVCGNADDENCDGVAAACPQFSFPNPSWQVASVADLGLNQAPLDDFCALVGGTVVVYFNGTQVENTCPGDNPTTSSNWASASKTAVLTTLLGRAKTRGLISGLDEPISNHVQGLTGKDLGITWRDLVNMVSGYSRGENPYSTGTSPVAYAYNDHAVNLEGFGIFDGIFNSSSPTSVLLAELPLGFEDNPQLSNSQWGRITDMSIRDMARLALLFAAKGYWNGEQLIESSYYNEYVNQVSDNLPRSTADGSESLNHGSFGGPDNQDFFIVDPVTGKGRYGLHAWMNTNGNWIDAPSSTIAWVGWDGVADVVIIEVEPGKVIFAVGIGSWGRPDGTFADSNDKFNRVAAALAAAVPASQCIEQETRGCYPGPPGTQDVGVCRAGTQTCSGGTFGPCTGATVPTSEVCNDGVDNDCDGQTDEEIPTFYQDGDADGFGNAAQTTVACTAPTGFVSNDLDCNDNDANIRPGATETCDNGVDEDCDGADLACLSLTNGLLGYWPFDDQTANDASGNNNNGTVNGGVTFTVNGKYGGAASFDGVTTSSISVSNPFFNDLTEFSVSVWFNTTANARGDLFASKDTGSSNNVNINANEAPNKARTVFRPGNIHVLDSSVAVNDGAWHNLVFVKRSDNTVSLYLDGQLQGSLSGVSSTISGLDYTLLGNGFGSTGFNGVMDEVAVWNRALSADELSQIYSNGPII